jgi:hypothetical protein
MVQKFHKIHRLGQYEIPKEDTVYVEEKLDGANFRVWFDEDKTIRFGTRETEFPRECQAFGQFQRAVDYIRTRQDKFMEAIKYNPELQRYIFYLECMTKHTLNYDWEITPPVVLFDIFDTIDNRYLALTHKGEIANNLDIKTPQLVYCGQNREFTESDIPKSAYGPFQAEGIVVKPMVTKFDIHGTILRGKLVRQEFKEQNHKVFNAKNGEDPKENLFVLKYVTEPRLEKLYLKMKERGVKKEGYFPFMSNGIVFDIVSEEIKQVIAMKKVSFVTMKKAVDDIIRKFLTEKGDI